MSDYQDKVCAAAISDLCTEPRNGKFNIGKEKDKTLRDEASKPGASHNVPREKRCQNARHIYIEGGGAAITFGNSFDHGAQ